MPSQGQATVTLQEASDASDSSGRTDEQPDLTYPRSSRIGSDSSPANSAAIFDSLLDSAPVELDRISEQVRARPELEALVSKLARSLQLIPGNSSPTIEEAAVVLGTDRLRIIVYMWSLLEGRCDSAILGEPSDGQSTRHSASSRNNKNVLRAFGVQNMETLYLVSFLRGMGLVPSANVSALQALPPRFCGRAADLAELTDLLLRDFLSLIPVLHSELLGLRSKIVAADRNDRSERGAK
jgi:hypothetical protein